MADRAKRPGARRRSSIVDTPEHKPPVDMPPLDTGNVPMAAAMMMQAGVRRLLVRARKARLIQRREVVRRRRQRNAALTNEVFVLSGNDALKLLHKHSDEAIESTANQMAATRKAGFVRYLGIMNKRLLDSLEMLQRVAASPSDGAACDEMALLLCELLQGSQCDIYPVEVNDGQELLKVNHKVFLPTRQHGLFCRDEHRLDSAKGGKPISYANLDLSSAGKNDADKADEVSMLEWYEPRHGYRELLVRLSEQDRVAATLRERGFKSSRTAHRLKEYGHALVVPVWQTPPRAATAARSSASPSKRRGSVVAAPEPDDDAEGPPPALVALIQLVRPPDAEPFTADDEYLASMLAPHLALALKRARVLNRVQSQLSKLLKLHHWAGGVSLESPEDLLSLASSLFSSDDVALYAMVPHTDAESSGAAAATARRRGISKEQLALESATLTTVRKGASTPVDSVAGLEVLCKSGQSLALSQSSTSTSGGARRYDPLLNLLRRPFSCSTKSMLVVPCYVHAETLKVSNDETAVIPCLLQWANAHDKPFGRSDVLVAQALTDVLGRLSSTRALKKSQALLEQRFKEGDSRRNALMESARMLANRMEMEELFAAVMVHAKDLMEVDRSTLFMVDKARETMFTIVADGAAPIRIPVSKGLAGAAFTTGKVVNIPDAYLDPRFNREIDSRSGYRTKSVLCYPIYNSRDEVIAVIQLINKLTGTHFSTADEELIAAFCAQLAVSIENILAIQDMDQSQRLAAEQKQRMHKFLDVVGVIVHGLPAMEVCERAQRAAKECTDSMGAALYICPDNAPDVLDQGRLDLDEQEDDHAEDTVEKPGHAEKLSFKIPAKKSKEPSPADVEQELAQLVPSMIEGMWPAVMRFAQSVVTANGALEDVVDVNDNGLPEALRMSSDPNMVSCLAVPISMALSADADGADGEGSRKVLGVLAVWGGRHEYTPADQQVLSTLAVLAAHLLTTNDAARQADKTLAMQRERVRVIEAQRKALVRFTGELGTPEPSALHNVAHQLHHALNCSACTLWLLATASTEQRLVTVLPADGKAYVKAAEDLLAAPAAAAEGGEGEAAENTTPPLVIVGKTADESRTTVAVPMSGVGIIGHCASTGKAFEIGDAHIHHAYEPEVDESVCPLEEEATAMMVAPLRDHTGRVIGVLQASGKQPAKISPDMPEPGLWEQDEYDTPRFSSSDLQFLNILADRMAHQLQLLTLTGGSPTEVVDQQSVAQELQTQSARLQLELLEKKRQMHALPPPRRAGGVPATTTVPYDPARHRRSVALTRSASTADVMGGGGVLSGPVRLPAVDPARGPMGGPMHSAEPSMMPSRGRRGGVSQFGGDLSKGPAKGPTPPKSVTLGVSPSAGAFGDFDDLGGPRRGTTPPSSVHSQGPPKLNTPDAVWEDLCRTLREL